MNYEANSPNPALTGIHQHPPPGTHLERGKRESEDSGTNANTPNPEESTPSLLVERYKKGERRP